MGFVALNASLRISHGTPDRGYVRPDQPHNQNAIPRGIIFYGQSQLGIRAALGMFLIGAGFWLCSVVRVLGRPPAPPSTHQSHLPRFRHVVAGELARAFGEGFGAQEGEQSLLRREEIVALAQHEVEALPHERNEVEVG